MNKIKVTLKSNLSQWEKVINLANELPNDMDLGKVIRTLVSEHNDKAKKPPFTEDYVQ